MLSRVFQAVTESARALTQGEIALAKSVYGDQIDYSKIRIYQGCLLARFKKDVAACVVENDIYYTPENYRDDFSKGDLWERKLFIHELMHVNQNQHSVSLPLNFFKLLIQYKGDYNQAYDLPKDTRDFYDYNFEQQAVIVAKLYECGEKLKEKDMDQGARDGWARAFSYYCALLPADFEPLKDQAHYAAYG